MIDRFGILAQVADARLCEFMSNEFDIIVIGAGIAGASVAAHLAETRSVAILEMEERPGYHTTGRSASMYEPNYGPPSMLALTRAARQHFDEGGFLTPRETMFVMPDGQEDDFEKLMAKQKGISEISVSDATRRFPLLREGYAKRAILDSGTADIDVDLLHNSYLRLFRQRGGELHCSSPVTAIEKNGQWKLRAGDLSLSARIIVDAAGAWGDAVAALAGKKPVGLQPKRRSVAIVPAPDCDNFMSLPMVGDIGETWYCKPHPSIPMMPMPTTWRWPKASTASSRPPASRSTTSHTPGAACGPSCPMAARSSASIRNAKASSGSSARVATASSPRPHSRGSRQHSCATKNLRPTSWTRG